jgi:sugar lactone lactonase YvrE
MHTGESEPLGELYRLDSGGVLTPVVKGVTVSNGLAWSPDGARLYYADSPLRRAAPVHARRAAGYGAASAGGQADELCVRRARTGGALRDHGQHRAQ